jgi:hypothetical protein
VSWVLAHGLGAVRDLPVPLWLFYYGAGLVLIVSFVALGALWKRPLLERHADGGRELPAGLRRVLLSRPLRIVLQTGSALLLLLVFLAALIGEDSVAANIAPTFVYVIFWVGLVVLVVLLGNVWPVLNPWRAVADFAAWLGGLGGVAWSAPARYPERLGRWPAAGGLFLFTALELCYPNSARPPTLALAIAIYSWLTWLGMAAFGREAWTQNGEAFSSYFSLLGRLSAFGARDDAEGRRTLVVRTPASTLARGGWKPGTVAFVTVMLGSVAFDGFSGTRFWQDRVFAVESPLALDSPGLANLAVTGLNLLGLLAGVAAVALIYLLAVEGARRAAGRSDSLADDFAGSLVPIAFAYALAHYFTLLVLQGQALWYLISDPFGRGWDLFGTASYRPVLDLLSPNTVWYVQVGALVVGHVLGLALAHDRAVALFRSPGKALRTQYAMLVLMVAYTVGGLWLLSTG